MAKPNLSYRSLGESYASSRNPVKTRSKIFKYSDRIIELSQPKLRHSIEEEIVGPGSYTPSDMFLSTTSKSPVATLGRSERFIKSKIPAIKFAIRHLGDEKDLSCINYSLSDIKSPPKFSFNRTGHNLNLVENPSVPGVGRYYLNAEASLRSCSFTKARKIFDWKKASRGWLH
ncbi:hypothetical protein SteCoe_28450 [Stentor coeruleus]|uniref:Uncharacterized protein n=1 Tax=Stentor coeruleus TaxID=5963 RepID=A0A1R2B856_9CILI|nr:hypothetical protein SteCoe_28450 [Stentor coeruleus]